MNDAEKAIIQKIKNEYLRYQVYEAVNKELVEEIDGLRDMYGSAKIPDSEIEARMQRIIKDYGITGMRGEDITAKLEEMKNVAYHRQSKAEILADAYRVINDRYYAGTYASSVSLTDVVKDLEFRYGEYISELDSEYKACKDVVDLAKIANEISKKQEKENGKSENASNKKDVPKKNEYSVETPEVVMENQPGPRRQPEVYEEEEEFDQSNIMQFGSSSLSSSQNDANNGSKEEAERYSIEVLKEYLRSEMRKLSGEIGVLDKYTRDVPKPKKRALKELEEKKLLYNAVQEKMNALTNDMTFSEAFTEEERTIDKIDHNKAIVDRYDRKLEKIDKKTKEKKSKKAYYEQMKIPVVSKVASGILGQSLRDLKTSEIKVINKQRKLVNKEIQSFYKRVLANTEINISNNVQQASNGHGSR